MFSTLILLVEGIHKNTKGNTCYFISYKRKYGLFYLTEFIFEYASMVAKNNNNNNVH